MVGDRGVLAALGPEDNLGAPRIDERAAEAVELAPVVVAPKNLGAEFVGGVEDAVLIVVVADEHVDAYAPTGGERRVAVALRMGTAVDDVVDPHVEVPDARRRAVVGLELTARHDPVERSGRAPP